MASPYSLEDLKNYGFNILNIANNHTLDYSHKGLEATIKYLNASDIPFCGAGMTLAEVAQPKYVECAEGRAALSIQAIFYSLNYEKSGFLEVTICLIINS